MNFVGLLSHSDRYLSHYSLESLTGDRPAPVFHHQHPSAQSVSFRSAVDHYRYEQPPSPSRPPSAAFCYRQFVGRQPCRGLPQRLSASSSSSLSPPSSVSSMSSPAAAVAGPVDYSPKTGVGSSSAGKPANGGVSSTTGGQRRSSAFQEGVTIGYTYDAFFVSDGRSRRRGSHAGTSPSSPSERVHQQPAAAPSPPSHRHGQNRQRYTCVECGKHYATSSNLSRHKQTHRSLDSQQARQCPHCGKVTTTNFTKFHR